MSPSANSEDKQYDGASRRLVWVITGTSSGLGRSLVHVALARGDCVIATARSVDSIREILSNPETKDRIHTMSLDVTAPFAYMRELASEAVGRWGRVDVLVNNAGVGMLGISEEVGVEGYQTQFNTNFFGPMNVTHAFLPYMRAQREGTIVFVGSRSSWRANVPMLGTYAASKAALIAAAEALSTEVAQFNIKVLNVLPGGMRTQNWKKMSLLPTAPEALLPSIPKSGSQNFNDKTPSGAVATESPSLTNSRTTTEEQHIADYAELRTRQIEWMDSVVCSGDAEKCAHAIINYVTDDKYGVKGLANDDVGGGRDWSTPGLLVLGADAEANIREKCSAVLTHLDEWRDVVRGIALDE
ncbi:NAD-binding protein [Fomitiporia mediterranea MF3/22]|uniref:NAD-binding protein n=1 Tax=Fomitiporia mediterranea (strain MF3/22) TaxID=694068 RepID=UPI0004409516|nr:NAD-binding protein [Fomitiporia mediterranea MF3/22]EJC99368.1 NAD-binding protein [Fomitiporia mediterranea MF3/22]